MATIARAAAMRWATRLLAEAFAFLWGGCAHAAVRVIVGPTPIPGGQAKARGDIQTARLAVPAAGGWDALIVEDRARNTAYTNPIWTRPN